jgi:fructoselysine 6-kinase
MQDYDLTDEDLDFIIQQDCIHTDLSWKVTKFLPMIRKNNTKIYFDFSKRFSHPDVNEICRHINWGIFSFNQDTPQVRDLLMKGCQLGAEVLIATFGERGALACDGKDYYFQPALPTPYLVNTVGAGDSFGAGFLSGILSGKSIDKSMQLGAEKACEIVSIFEPYNIRE